MSSSEHTPRKGWLTRLLQLIAGTATFALFYWASRQAPPPSGGIGAVAAVGFLLLAGTLTSELLEPLGLPHLTGYLLAGVVGGPHLLQLMDSHAVEHLSSVNTLALALIALAGGAELRLSVLRDAARSIAWAMLLQSLIVFFVCAVTLGVLARYLPFARGLGLKPLIGVCLLWGVLAISRSPSVVLGILTQTRAQGPLATFSLAFVMASDVVVVVLLTFMLMLARPLITDSGGFSLDALQVLGHELLGSVAVGTTLGLALAAYLRLVGRHLLALLLILGFGATEFLHYVHVDPLLAFLTAGFVVQNLSQQGSRLLEAIEQTGGVVFVVFFATAGAHLDVPLLQRLWPVALGLCLARALATVVAARLGSRFAKDKPAITEWGWSALISQAGLTLGLAVVIGRLFPELGPGFAALIVATVAVNEVAGPVLFKIALDRVGESRPETARASLPVV